MLGTNKYKLYQAIGEGRPPAKRPAKLDDISGGFWDLLEACWDTESAERPTATGICYYLDREIQVLTETLSLSYGHLYT
jgi:hypothetical protein